MTHKTVSTSNVGVTDGNQPKYITINLQKAFSILAGAVIAAFVSGAVAALYTANSDHFLLLALDSKVGAFDTTYARRDVIVEQFNTLQTQMASHIRQMEAIEKSIQTISNRLDKID